MTRTRLSSPDEMAGSHAQGVINRNVSVDARAYTTSGSSQNRLLCLHGPTGEIVAWARKNYVTAERVGDLGAREVPTSGEVR